MNVFLTRKQHDAMMDKYPKILTELFKGKKKDRKWSLSGVTFLNVSEELFIKVMHAL